jgi:hypothetical protein
MSTARPSAQEERWRVLASRYETLRVLAHTHGEAGSWKYATLLSRCLFFVLGLFAAGLTYSMMYLMSGLSSAGFIAGCTLLVVAEALINAKRMFASGIEESLWVAGILMLVFAIFQLFPGNNELLAIWLVAAALALAGWRLLNPLLTTAAALVASAAIAFTNSQGWQFQNMEIAGYICFAVAFLALAAGSFKFKRPSHDRMLDWLVVALPAAGYFWQLVDRPFQLTLDSLSDPWLALLLPFLLVIFYGIAALTTGLQRRTHAPLIAALVCVLLLAYELRSLTGLALQWRLIIWGTVGLIAARVIERALRTPRNGITSQDIEDRNAALDLAQVGGSIIATHNSTATAADTPPAESVAGQGGEFGGGGASGRF